MFGNGNESADILIIGGVLGESEISEGKPIAGRSERLLNNILEKANISKDNIYFHNVICCRPPHNNINSLDAKIALKKCPTFHLINAIIKIRPKVIITLGNTAHKYFFNSEGILKKRGIVKFWNDYYVIPTLHPDYLLSGNSHLINDVVNDFILALSLVNKEENKVKSIIINSVEELSDLKKKLTQSGRFSFDIETTGLNSYRGDLTLGIAFSCNENEGYYLPLREKPIFGEDYDFINQDYIPIVKSLLEDEHLKKTLHNSSFDVEFLKVDFDINVKGIVADTMLLSHLLDENTPNDLDFLTNSNYKDLLGYKRESESKLKTLKSKSFAKLPFSILAKRACIDAVATYRLTNKFISKIKEDKKLYEYYIQIQLPLIPTLINIQLRGFGVNFNYSKEVKTLYEFALDNISNKIYKEVGYKFNINSDNDIRELLYVKLKLPILKYTSKSEDASVDEKTLSELYDKHKNIVLKYILAHNKVAKILNTYIIGMLPKAVDGRIHSKLNINGTRTSRISSSGPNQQNVAKNKHIKRIICPKEGYSYLYCDLAQCEIRIFSYLSNDEELMKACITKGQDIYLTMASIMYKKDINTLTKDSPERQSAKTIVLGTLYGLGIYKMANEIKRPVKEAKQIQTLFFKAFPNAKRFVNETIKTVRRTGQVQNVYGRIRRLPEIYSRDDDAKSEAERQAVNFLVQSVAADFVKYSLMRIEKEILERNIDGGIVITVHDSIICEIKDEQIKEFAPVFCKCMTDPVLGVNAPMEVDLMVGKNWWDLKKYDL